MEDLRGVIGPRVRAIALPIIAAAGPWETPVAAAAYEGALGLEAYAAGPMAPAVIHSAAAPRYVVLPPRVDEDDAAGQGALLQWIGAGGVPTAGAGGPAADDVTFAAYAPGAVYAGQAFVAKVCLCVCVCVRVCTRACVYVCVCERERELLH